MNLHREHAQLITRRHFFRRCNSGIGAVALASLMGRGAFGASTAAAEVPNPLASRPPLFPAKAKRVIFLFMVGGPSQMDLFDPKPALAKWHGKPLPETTGRPKSQFTSGKETILASTRKFKQHGKSGQWVSDLMPHFAGRVDDVCFLKACW